MGDERGRESLLLNLCSTRRKETFRMRERESMRKKNWQCNKGERKEEDEIDGGVRND